jgi:hypothetical protein
MTAPAADFSAAAFVKTLSDEQKEAVFYAILEEVLAFCPNSEMIPLYAADKRLLAHILTLKGSQTLFDKHGPKLSPEERAEIRERAKNSGPPITFEEMFSRLGWVGEGQTQKSALRATG